MQNKIKVTEHQLLVVSAIALAVASLSLIIIGQSQYRPKLKQPKAYLYPVPASTADTIIEAVPMGQRPRGWLADLPLYHNRSILQAYRADYPGYTSYHTTMVFVSDLEQKDVLEFYKNWFSTRGWPITLQPNDKEAEAIYTKQENHSALVVAISKNGATQVSVSYAQTE